VARRFYLKLFDLAMLPISNIIYKGGRQRLENDVQYDILPITHYDHFVSNGYEYIILPVQSQDTEAEAVLKLNNFKTVISRKKTNEPHFIAFRETNLPDTYTQKHDIVMCVYFLQNSNTEIERFLDYYLSQGIDKIFMYYCGSLSERSDLPQRERVEYLEWKYIHFLFFPYQGVTLWQHYAQVPLYNVFAKKIAPHCNWSFYSDIDEFIKAPEGTLHEYLKGRTSNEHLFTQHRWAKIDFKAKQVECEESTNEPARGKTILKGGSIKPHETMHNHHSMQAVSCDLLMFHNRHHPNWDKVSHKSLSLK
jgi:hypothetical protein